MTDTADEHGGENPLTAPDPVEQNEDTTAPPLERLAALEEQLTGLQSQHTRLAQELKMLREEMRSKIDGFAQMLAPRPTTSPLQTPNAGVGPFSRMSPEETRAYRRSLGFER